MAADNAALLAMLARLGAMDVIAHKDNRIDVRVDLDRMTTKGTL